MDTVWFELALLASFFVVGNIVFGHFEEGTPKWRRVAKFFVFMIVTFVLITYAGRIWFYALLGLCFIAVLVIHAWWLPRLGINGWTAQPREKYYQLRGWKLT